MEDSKEDEVEVSVEEEDEVIDLCNIIIVDHCGISREIVQNYKSNVVIVSLRITQLNTVHN